MRADGVGAQRGRHDALCAAELAHFGWPAELRVFAAVETGWLLAGAGNAAGRDGGARGGVARALHDDDCFLRLDFGHAFFGVRKRFGDGGWGSELCDAHLEVLSDEDYDCASDLRHREETDGGDYEGCVEDGVDDAETDYAEKREALNPREHGDAESQLGQNGRDDVNLALPFEECGELFDTREC